MSISLRRVKIFNTTLRKVDSEPTSAHPFKTKIYTLAGNSNM